jgi:hypothetical protein
MANLDKELEELIRSKIKELDKTKFNTNLEA